LQWNQNQTNFIQDMKKLKAYFLLTLMTGLSLFTACKDDEADELALDGPEIEVPSTSLAVQKGQSTTFSVPVAADGKIAAVAVSADQGTATLANETALIGKYLGTASISFQAPETAGTATITLTVTDHQATPRSATESITVQITEEAQVEVVEVLPSADGIGTTTWTKDKIYVLRGFIYVNEGQTLTIEEGTIIKGQPGTGPGASAFIVARGGKIMAEGTAEEPIIFTSIEDDIQPGETMSTLPASTRGLWGGVLILGKAGITTSAREANIEGIPVTETRGLYGGSDDDDDSGVFKYVSIRYGGTEIGEGNEINGLTLAGVGRGTTIEYVEVISNKDDGFEWFGGTVNTKYLLSAYCGDDAMDYDEGWRGNNQFWLVYQDGEGDRGGEHDGGSSDCETCEPYAIPVIANATYRGGGSNRALTFRDNAGGKYFNSIFLNYGKGVDIEDLEDDGDSYNQLKEGNLEIKNNIFWNVAGNDASKFVVLAQPRPNDTKGPEDGADLSGETHVSDNISQNPELNSLFVPAADVSSTIEVEGDFFQNVAYKGAFDPNADTPWHAGWTQWSQIDNIQ
jgi:hypothetical protein